MRTPNAFAYIEIKYIIIGFILCLSLFLKATNEKDEAKLGAGKLLNQIPICFVENKGQIKADETGKFPSVLYSAETPGVNLFLTEKGLTYILLNKTKTTKGISKNDHQNINDNTWTESDRIDMILKSASIRKENIVAEERSTNFNQYYLPHCPQGIKASAYHKIIIKDIYEGIDWVLYNNSENGFKYDFVIHPGANPKDIDILFECDGLVELNNQHSLKIITESGVIKDEKLMSYQNNKSIITNYNLIKLNQSEAKTNQYSVTFDIHKYDKTQNLVIDPVVTWATQIDVSSVIRDVKCDALGNVFVLGLFSNSSPPITILNSGSGYHQAAPNGMDIVIYKFDKNGVLLWCSNYGGSLDDSPNMLAISPTNEVYATGRTSSIDLPTLSSGGFFQANSSSTGPNQVDAFIIKFDSNCNLLWATYFGGNNVEDFTTGCFDLNGNLVLGGLTGSTNLPMVNSSGYFDNSFNGGLYDGFILKFSNADALLHSTYIGGNGSDFDTFGCLKMKADNQGNLWLAGNTRSLAGLPYTNNGGYFKNSVSGSSDAIFAKFDQNFNLIWFSTYGGNDVEASSDLTIDRCGNVWVLGMTLSQDLLSVNANGYMHAIAPNDSLEGFIVKMNPNNNIVWSTYLGGNKADWFLSLLNDGLDIWAIGFTNSTDIPIVSSGSGLNQSTMAGGEDGMIYRFDQTTSLIYSTYFGNSNVEEVQVAAIDTANARLYFAGQMPNAHLSPFHYQTQPIPSSYVATRNDDGFIVQLSIDIPKLPHTKIVYDSAICSNNALLLLQATNPSLSGYVWNNGVTTFSNTVTNSGTYWVDYSQTCALFTDTFHVTINQIPLVTVPSNITIERGDDYQINASINISSPFTWSPTSDLSCTNCLATIASPNETTNYCLTSSTASNCKTTVCFTIYVEDKKCPTLDAKSLPEAFTPNEDNNNDIYVIYVVSDCLKEFNIQIFDRWGEKIYETIDPKINWDGKYNGKYLDTGIYIYQLTATTANGEKIKTKGSISLIK
jgi:gliding motility-associated-like protein